MAGRPPKRYEPGELERTRKHLGTVSEQEARRVANILGGEVGLEKTSKKVEEKYRKIHELNRRRSDRFVREPSERSTSFSKQVSQESTPGIPPEPTPRPATSRTGYIERLRMDFLAAQPEHQLKTQPAAMAALFSLIVPVRDFVNPLFIASADERFFTSIENLVVSVRQLLARYEKSPMTLMRIPYYEEILRVIAGWDLETMSREIARLQTHPRRRSVTDCSRLCQLVYRPIVRLLDLDPRYHIGQALKHVYDFDVASLPKGSPDLAKVKLAYTMGRDGISRVFVDLKRSLYPLLMKLASVHFSAYSDYFASQRIRVLAYLSLTPADLLPPKDREKLSIESKTVDEEGSTNEGDAPTEEEGTGSEGGDEEQPRSLPGEVSRALQFMDQLFPQAGFVQIAEFPDMYPYFQPILKLPRGVELIAADDPLQQVVIIVALLQEIFYGLRSIQFRDLGDEESGPIAIGEKIENLTANWHLFLDELIGKNYVSSLFEYCRQLQLGVSTLRGSEYLSRLESELRWIKRHYFLPRLKVKVFKGLHPNMATDLPELPKTVREMRELLERVIDDVARGKLASIANPWAEFSFAVEGYVSKRVRTVLRRRANPESFLKRRSSNVSYVFHTLLIVRALDFLINDDQSPYTTSYTEAHQPLYRADITNEGAPQYTVPVEDTYRLIEQSERDLFEELQKRRDGSPASTDSVTGFETTPTMVRKLRELIRGAARDSSFVAMPISLRRYSEILKQRGETTAELWVEQVALAIGAEIREFEDLPYRVGSGAFIVVLPETEAIDAVHLADRLTNRFKEIDDGAIPISVGIVEYQKGWSIERLLKTATLAIREAARHASPSVVVHEGTTNTFIPHA